MANNTAEGLIGKLGLTRKELENASKTFTKEELAKLLNYDLSSFFGRYRFDSVMNRIYHFDNGEQLVFMEITPGNYTPKLGNPREDYPDRPVKDKPFCSNKQ
jgi:hypothetical protein